MFHLNEILFLQHKASSFIEVLLIIVGEGKTQQWALPSSGSAIELYVNACGSRFEA